MKNQSDTESKHENKLQNMKRQSEDNSRLSDDQLSRIYETIENQRLEKVSYMSQVKELEETILDLFNTIVDLKSIPNKKSSEDVELQDVNAVLNKEPERLIKMQTVSVTSSETNDNHTVELEGLLITE